MGVATPVTAKPPAATSVADAMVVLASTAFVARSVQDTRVPGVAADRFGSGGSPLPPQAVRTVAEPLSSKAETEGNFLSDCMDVSCGLKLCSGFDVRRKSNIVSNGN
jgi:hypothetical protein